MVVNGHPHNYERFAPQTPNGVADRNEVSGSSLWAPVVGRHHGFGTIQPNSEVRNGCTSAS